MNAPVERDFCLCCRKPLSDGQVIHLVNDDDEERVVHRKCWVRYRELQKALAPSQGEALRMVAEALHAVASAIREARLGPDGTGGYGRPETWK